MKKENGFKEWKSNDVLPEAFVNWLNETITEKALQEKIGFMQIAGELNVDAALLSRWLAGMGPLTREHVHTLATTLGHGVYTVLGLKRPNNPRQKVYQNRSYPRS